MWHTNWARKTDVRTKQKKCIPLQCKVNVRQKCRAEQKGNLLVYSLGYSNAKQ